MYLDLNILETNNLKTLAIGDNSYYDPGLNIISPTIEITPPGFAKVVQPFSPNNINVFNSISLNITPGVSDPSQATYLPDGFWTVRYSVYPNTTNFVVVNFMKLDILKLNFHNAFMYLDFDECDSKIKEIGFRELMHIRTLIDGAIAAGSTCNQNLAVSLYNIANKYLKKFFNTYINGVCDFNFVYL